MDNTVTYIIGGAIGLIALLILSVIAKSRNKKREE